MMSSPLSPPLSPPASSYTSNDNDANSTAAVRLAKLMARAGVDSRRRASVMIQRGQVLVDNVAVTDPCAMVRQDQTILVDGQPLPEVAPTQVWCLNKPRRVLTSRFDMFDRRTVMNLLPDNLQHLMPVGRLDNDSEGLLLLTNDGQLKQNLERPCLAVLSSVPDSQDATPDTLDGRPFLHQHGRPPQPISRGYMVAIRSPIVWNRLQQVARSGLTVDAVHYRPFGCELVSRHSHTLVVRLTLFEGKNREIRRIVESVGGRVQRLVRVSFAGLRLGRLPGGRYYRLPEAEIARLRQIAGLGSHT